MTLREQNQIHSYDGGAYRRVSWPTDQYWHYNARPTSLQSGMIGIDESVPTSQGKWIGSVWSKSFPRWVELFISASEANENDWEWITTNQILNITNTSASDPIAPTNVGKQLNETGQPGEPIKPLPLGDRE